MTAKIKNKKGFTLTELIVVIVVIGILAAVLIPTLTGYITKAKKSAAEQEAAGYKTAYVTWLVEEDQLVDAEGNPKYDGFQAYCVGELDVKLSDGQLVETFKDGKSTGYEYISEDGKYKVTYTHATGKLSVSDNE